MTSGPRNADPVIRYFDEVAQDYLGAYEPTETGARSFLFRERRRAARDLLGSLPGGIIADVGCGPAIFAGPELAGFRWIFIDLSEGMIRQAKRHLERAWGAARPPVACVVGDVERLPLRGQCVDAVICLGVLDYVADHRLVLQEAFRALRPGGTLIVSIPNRRSLLGLSYRLTRVVLGPLVRRIRLLDRYVPPTSLLRQPGLRVREYLVPRIAAEMERMGFGLQEIRWLGFLCPLARNWQIQRLSRLARWLAKTLPVWLSGWLARTCMIAARKRGS